MTAEALVILASLAVRGDAGALIEPGTATAAAVAAQVDAGYVCVGGHVVDARGVECYRVRITLAGSTAHRLARMAAAA